MPLARMAKHLVWHALLPIFGSPFLPLFFDSILCALHAGGEGSKVTTFSLSVNYSPSFWMCKPIGALGMLSSIQWN